MHSKNSGLATFTPAPAFDAIGPDQSPTFVLTAQTPSFNEGSSDLFTLTTTGVAAGTIYDYALTGLPASDFPNGDSTGSVTIGADGIAYISVSVLPDVLSASAQLTLSVAGVSDVVTVNDTSSSPSGTYTLTTGADTIVTPSTGNFTVIGDLGQLDTSGREALGTFSVGDNITGDGADTTLLINQNQINTNGNDKLEYDLVPIGVTLTNVGTVVIDSVQALGGIFHGAADFFDLTTNAQNNTSFSGLDQVDVSNSSGNDYLSISGTTSLNLVDTSGSVTTEGGNNVTIETFDPGTGGKPASVTVGGGPNGAPTGDILVNDLGTGSVNTYGGTNVTVNLGAGLANKGVFIAGETGNVVVDGGSSATPLAGTATIYGGATDTVTASGAVAIYSQASGAAPGQPGISVTEYGSKAPVTIGTLGETGPSYDPSGNVVVTDQNQNGADNTGLVTIDTNGAQSVSVTGGTAGGITDYQTTVEGGVSTLSTVTLSGVAGTETIDSDALNALNLYETNSNPAGSTKVVVNSALPQTLALTLDADITAYLTDNSAVALDIVADGSNPGLVLSAANADLISITGSTLLGLAGSANLGQVNTLDISGGAGFTDAGTGSIGADPLADYRSLARINGATSSNSITATINADQAFTGGSGSDTVTISSDQLRADDLGSSTTNTLVVNNVGSDFTAANTGANVTGYSDLKTTASSGGTYDLTHVFDSPTTVEVAAAPAAALVFTNASLYQTLSIDQSLGKKGIYLAVKSGAVAKALTLNIGTASTSGIDTSDGTNGQLGKTKVVTPGYQDITLNSVGAPLSTGTNTVLLVDNQVGLNGGTLTIDGNESLDLGNIAAPGKTILKNIAVETDAGTTVNLTHFSASSSGVVLTIGDASVLFNGYATSIKTDSVTAGNGNNVLSELGAGGLIVTAGDGDNSISSVGGVLDLALGDGNNSVTGNNATSLITEGNGTDTVSVGTGQASLSQTVTLGSGNYDTVTVGSVKSSATDTITLGGGYGDRVTAGNGPLLISLGDGDNDTVTAGNGPDVITVGDGNDVVTVGNGDNKVTAGAGADQITLGSGANVVSANVGAASPGGVTLSFSATSAGGNTLTLGDGTNVIQGSSALEGANTITVGNGTNTIGVGDGDNTITAGNGSNVITVGNGTNDISTGSGSNAITLGDGANNIVNLAAHPQATDKIVFATPSTSGIDQFSGLAHHDSIQFQQDGHEVWNGGSAASAQVIEPPNATFQDYLNAACFGNGSTNGIFSWFSYSGNDYVVEDRSNAGSFVAGTDLVFELPGNQSSLILGSTLNGTTHSLTF